MIIKGSIVCVPYLFMWIKNKSVTFYIETKKGGGAYTIASKRTFHFNMFPQNKLYKLRQTKNNETKEENYWNYTTVIKYDFCFLVSLFFIC